MHHTQVVIQQSDVTCTTHETWAPAHILRYFSVHYYRERDEGTFAVFAGASAQPENHRREPKHIYHTTSWRAHCEVPTLWPWQRFSSILKMFYHNEMVGFLRSSHICFGALTVQHDGQLAMPRKWTDYSRLHFRACNLGMRLGSRFLCYSCFGNYSAITIWGMSG